METFVTPSFEIVRVPSVTELLATREKLIGYKTVVVELGEAPTGLLGDHSQRPVYQSAIGSIREATCSWPSFEGLKALFASTLETVPGPCIYFDRGNFCYLKFRPGDEVNPIEPAKCSRMFQKVRTIQKMRTTRCDVDDHGMGIFI